MTRRLRATPLAVALVLSLVAPPVATATSGETPTPIYGLRNGALTRRAASGAYVGTDRRRPGSFSMVRRNAFAALALGSAPVRHPNVEFTYDVSATFPRPLVGFIQRELDEAATLWNDVFESTVTVRVGLLTEQDGASIAGDAWYERNLPAIFARLGSRTERPFIAGGGAYFERQGAWTGNIYLVTASYLDLRDARPEWPQVARHEFFHVVQDYMMLRHGRVRPATDSGFDAVQPSHFREGGANAVSYLTAFRNLGWSSDALDGMARERTRNARHWARVRTVGDVVALMRATERSSPPEAFELSYAIGALMYEWVLGTYGREGFTALLGQLSTAPTFDDALRGSIGLTLEELYARSAPYVLSVLAPVRNQ